MKFYTQTRSSKIVAVAVIVVLTLITIPGLRNISEGAAPAQVGKSQKNVQPARVGGVAALPGETQYNTNASSQGDDGDGEGSNTDVIIDVHVFCSAVPTRNSFGQVTGWDFTVSGSQVHPPATQVKLHTPWGAFIGPGSGTTSTHHYEGAAFPGNYSATAETFAIPGYGGSHAQCQFEGSLETVTEDVILVGHLALEKTAPTTTERGAELTFGIKVTNNGQKRVNSFTLFDNIDNNLTFLRSNPAGCTVIASAFPRGTVKCENTTSLNAGTSVTYQLTFKVDATVACDTVISNKADVTSPDAPNNWSNMTSTKVNCPPPQLVCTPASQTVDINQIASLSASGGTGSYSWAASGGNPTSGSGSTFATKYATSGTKVVKVTSGSQEATCQVIVDTEKFCQLEITKATNKSEVVPGEEFTYTINFKNVGTKDCTGNGVKVADTIDSNLIFVRQSHSANVSAGYKDLPVYHADTRTAYWNAGTLTPGEAGTVSLTVKAREMSQCSEKTIPNFAKITAAEYSNFQTWVNSNTVHVKAKTDCEQALVCTPHHQHAHIGRTVSVSASGGTGSYAWSTPDSTTRAVQNNSVSVSYSTVGSKAVTVTSGGQSATCYININQNYTNLSVIKVVRNVTQNGPWAENLSNVKAGDVIEYQIKVRNSGTIDATGVTLNDFLNKAGVLTDFRNLNVSRAYSGQLYNGNLSFSGTLAPNQEIVVGYLYTIAQGIGSNISVCNTATAAASNATGVSDTACVTSTAGAPNLVLSKSAWNDTKNIDATSQPASREDFITYKLTVKNTGTVESQNFVVTDDLSGVLPLADMVDMGGGQLSGQTISYPAVNIPAGGSITKMFRVRIKYHLAASISYHMVNVYGNTVTIVINPPPVYTPPKTGGMIDLLTGIGFAGLLTSAFALHRKKNLVKLIFS